VRGLDLGQPLGQQRRLGAQGADAGMRHGDGAHMPALGLRREIEPHRPGRRRARLVAAVMSGGMDAVADAFDHQGVISRMEFHEIDAVALAIDDVELGRILVGDPAEIERVGRTIILAAGRQGGEVEPGARRRIRQRPVGAEQVDVAEVGRLVERGIFEQAGGHAASLPQAEGSRAATTKPHPEEPRAARRLEDARQRRCIPPFETRSCGPLLRVRSNVRKNSGDGVQPSPSYLKESFSLVR